MKELKIKFNDGGVWFYDHETIIVIKTPDGDKTKYTFKVGDIKEIEIK